MSSTYIVGTVGIDTIETPYGMRDNVLGGSAVHAGMAARFFIKPAIVSCVGDDFPEEHKIFLEQYVDIGELVSQPKPTFRWHGRYERSMERVTTLRTELGAVASFRPRIKQEADLKAIFLANNNPEHQMEIMERSGKDVPIILDTMDFWIHSERKALLEALKRADLVVLNIDEAAELTGEHGVIKSGQALLERFGVKRVIVKKGEHGSAYFGPEGYRVIPAYPIRNVVDPTGAGDSFAGALLGTIASVGSLSLGTILEGMMNGTVLSSFIIEDFGCNRLAEIEQKDIEARKIEFKNYFSFDKETETMQLSNTQESQILEPSLNPSQTLEGNEGVHESEIRDSTLSDQGRLNIELAEQNMKALMKLRERFSREKPFNGLTIGMALHVTKETAVLVKTLVAGGAKVAITGCNPLSTQDDVAAALAQEEGVLVFAHKGESSEDYYRFINYVIDSNPNITIDDGCDLVTELHTKRQDKISNVVGGCEETTTGIFRLKAMEKEGVLKYPIVAVNNNKTKHLVDNYYGTGQSTLDGLIRASNMLIAGKTLAVVGYGSCGKGLTMRARGMGANVIVCETDPFRAFQAVMDGFRVMPMAEAAKIGDVFITVSGNKHVIRLEHVREMKDGVVLANSGHFDNEIDLVSIEQSASSKRRVRPNYFDEYIIDGKRLYVAGEGRLVNLACAEGHPSEVMSLSFCGQVLACEWLVKQQKCHDSKDTVRFQQALDSGSVSGMTTSLEPKLYILPPEIDEEISKLQLEVMGVRCDELTPEQKEYLSGWKEGT